MTGRQAGRGRGLCMDAAAPEKKNCCSCRHIRAAAAGRKLPVKGGDDTPLLS